MSDTSEYLVLSVNRTKNLELGDVSVRCMEGSVRGSLMRLPLTVVDLWQWWTLRGIYDPVMCKTEAF